MSLSRDRDFQELLDQLPATASARSSWPRARQDTVTSEWLITGATARSTSPTDYLEAFARVRPRERGQVEAIRILLDRPQDWGTAGPSTSCDRSSRQTPEHFTEDNLQKAHEVRYHKALVDIISMVKHAALDSIAAATPPRNASNRAVDARQPQGGSSRTSRRSGWTASASTWSQNLSIDQRRLRRSCPCCRDRAAGARPTASFDRRARRPARRA